MLMRHGIAEDAGASTGWRDEERALTDEGRERLATQARGMRALSIAPDVVLTSPLVRCAQTAEIVCARLGGVPRPDARLRPGLDLEALGDVLLEHPGIGTVLVCGHQPDMSELTEALTGGAQVEFRKGSLAVLDVEVPRFHGGTLVALYPPAQLRALAPAR